MICASSETCFVMYSHRYAYIHAQCRGAWCERCKHRRRVKRLQYVSVVVVRCEHTILDQHSQSITPVGEMIPDAHGVRACVRARCVVYAAASWREHTKNTQYVYGRCHYNQVHVNTRQNITYRGDQGWTSRPMSVAHVFICVCADYIGVYLAQSNLDDSNSSPPSSVGETVIVTRSISRCVCVCKAFMLLCEHCCAHHDVIDCARSHITSCHALLVFTTLLLWHHPWQYKIYTFLDNYTLILPLLSLFSSVVRVGVAALFFQLQHRCKRTIVVSTFVLPE